MAESLIQELYNRGTDLPEGYRRARKTYVIFGSLLLVFQIVGFDLPQVVSLFGTDITLKNPDLAPFLVFAATLYSAFRTSVEWFLCGTAARTELPARLDFFVAHGVAALGAYLFLAETAGVNSALINADPGEWVAITGLTVLASWSASAATSRWPFFDRGSTLRWLALPMFAVSIALGVSFIRTSPKLAGATLMMVAGGLLGGALWARKVDRIFIERGPNSSETPAREE